MTKTGEIVSLPVLLLFQPNAAGANYLAGSAGLVASGFFSGAFGALLPPQPTNETPRPTRTNRAINFFMVFPCTKD
jgi:hypothetical protein